MLYCGFPDVFGCLWYVSFWVPFLNYCTLIYANMQVGYGLVVYSGRIMCVTAPSFGRSSLQHAGVLAYPKPTGWTLMDGPLGTTRGTFPFENQHVQVQS